MRALAICIAGIAVPSAVAQLNTYDIVVSNVVSPAQSSATVELWARFDPQWTAFNGAILSFWSTPDEGGFGQPEAPLGKTNPGNKAGQVADDGDSVQDILVGQICDPIGNIFPDDANPILIWSVTWSTADFSPRIVDLSTLSVDYSLFLTDVCDTKSFINDNFSEAFGAITVVPAPGAALLLTAAGAASWRRRR